MHSVLYMNGKLSLGNILNVKLTYVVVVVVQLRGVEFSTFTQEKVSHSCLCSLDIGYDSDSQDKKDYLTSEQQNGHDIIL